MCGGERKCKGVLIGLHHSTYLTTQIVLIQSLFSLKFAKILKSSPYLLYLMFSMVLSANAENLLI
jgi:hypothetical protein